MLDTDLKFVVSFSKGFFGRPCTIESSPHEKNNRERRSSDTAPRKGKVSFNFSVEKA